MAFAKKSYTPCHTRTRPTHHNIFRLSGLQSWVVGWEVLWFKGFLIPFLLPV
jgi:hypothetical protein